MSNLSYPIGKFEFQESTAELRAAWINELKIAPDQLAAAVEGLTDAQLDTPYREAGWTLRQVVHHVADSHMNSYIRFRWALTEDSPVIKAYDEKVWADLTDAKTAAVDLSLNLLAALHARWVVLLENLSEADWKKDFVHPESKKEIPIDRNLAIYAWHGKHHIAQITSLKEREGWV